MLDLPPKAGQVVTKHLLRRSRQMIRLALVANKASLFLKMSLTCSWK